MINIKNEFVELHKSGKFYNSFANDAVIIHYLLGYRILAEKGGVGFPESAIIKVTNILNEKEISYRVYEKNELVEEKDYKKINKYKTILKKAEKELSVEERLNNIERKIRKLDNKSLDKLIDLIEDAIS